MIGDKLVITEYHRNAARKVMEKLEPMLAAAAGRPLAVSIAGESGSGKSEIAHCLGDNLEEHNLRYVILAQDDYFKLPPRSNHEKRLQDISWVGPQEVRLDLLDEHIEALKEHPEKPLEKPLVYFEENEIRTETINPGMLDVIIAEGTYTSLLDNVDLRVFIDRNYRQTKKARLARARDPDLDFLEKVLEIEHQEISRHKARADVIIDPPEEEKQ
ncbi:MAG: hypothetical protein D6806_14325 [Deltaproteobacteria bacterium]|nr:MAG: hypothetical protein D6806_14325 [Deltaproteobacteria bacterium]